MVVTVYIFLRFAAYSAAVAPRTYLQTEPNKSIKNKAENTDKSEIEHNISDLSSQSVQDVFKGKPLFSTDEICSRNFRVSFGELNASVRIVFEGEEDKGTGEISEKSREPGGTAISGKRRTTTKQQQHRSV